MRPSGAAAVSVGLWVLVTVNVVADPGVTEPRRCSLSHYRWLDPRALEAVKALRDHYVSDARTPSPRGRWSRQGRDPGPYPEGPGILASRRRISDLRAPPGGPGSPARSRGSLDEEIAASAPLRFLPGFQDSPRCHEATIIFNLLRLLTWDLKLAALSGPCL
ncbi:PREDICTED: interferon lambda-4 [Myotis brandtii]|uniref:interferon lambda-4 n=1 Tax=Myotis brandtii TaxID=109478 RepID=UPI000703FFCC|nr:PREDICTED: interferon lambda-4 [Myotis brandtii]